MKVKIELFGAARDFSDQNILELTLNNDSTIKDTRIEIIKYLEENFDGNKDFIRIVNTSAFSSENNNIVSDNYKITNNEKIAIIPPIGGG
ncbi:molybdopterin biosynthesis protein MoeD [Candidatus Pelagibacter sp.]|jgi:molybdopterin converting factor small subunit|nr:molybdopterin biosynthesis protein MoeD [Candidatus Pelagibacter sp.]|tara:strand:+ start:1506 stop:1775 length:270 start_codon:yes stop_codon:yes gene_type:complete